MTEQGDIEVGQLAIIDEGTVQWRQIMLSMIVSHCTVVNGRDSDRGGHIISPDTRAQRGCKGYLACQTVCCAMKPATAAR